MVHPPHVRRTLAVQAFPSSDVKAMTGHVAISTTMIYVHRVPQPAAAALWTALLETAPPPSGAAGTTR